MSIQVAPGVEKPTHHISLTGRDRWGKRTTVGITAVNRAGQPDIGAITSSPYPRTTVKIDTQEGTFVQMRPPFSRFSRNEFGGLGFLEGDADRTKYALGRKIWTAGGNSILMAPRLRRATIAYPVITLKGWGEDLTWIEMDSSTRRIIAGLVAAPTAAITAVQIRARVYHSRLKVTIYDDNGTGGIPGTVLGSGTGPAAGLDDTYMVELDSAVTATGNIWIGVETLAESEPYNRLGMYSSAAESGMYSANGTTWTAETSAYKMPSLGLRAQSGRANEWHFFEYRDGTYVVTGQRLFINGDRGACDDNTGALKTLIDGTKSWTPDALIGAIVKVIEGPGVGEWRTITDNDGTTLTVDTAWTTAHTTASSYVISKAKVWTEITGHGIPAAVVDVAVSKQSVIYFATGDGTALRRARFYNNSGTWTAQYDNDTASEGASHLLFTYDSATGAAVLWRAQNGTDGAISKAPTTDWNTNLTWGADIPIGDRERSINGLIDYDERIAALKSDGVWLYETDYAKKTSLNFGQRWGADVGRNPCIVTPYLMVPFGEKIERMYGTIFEDFGPEVNGGLPKYQNGVVRDTMNVVGGMLICKDGGGEQDYGVTVGESGVFLERNGWHPVAQFFEGDRVRAMTLQRGEDGVEWLWMAGEDGLYYMAFPRSFDYAADPNFTPDDIEQTGVFMTGWYDGGNLVNDKWWEEITLFATGVNGDTQAVEVWYQVDRLHDADADVRWDAVERWTYAGRTLQGTGTKDDGDMQAFRIPVRAAGKSVRFAFRLMSDVTASAARIERSPRIYGYTVDFLERVAATNQYSLTLRLKDVGYDRHLRQRDMDVMDMSALLDAWASAIEPLEMRSVFAPFDNKRVLIDRPGLRPVTRTEGADEEHMASLTLIEVGPVDEATVDDGLVLAFVRGGTALEYCADVTADGATFSAVALPTGTTAIQDVMLDGDGESVWLATEDGVYRTMWMGTGTPTWTLIWTHSQLAGAASFLPLATNSVRFGQIPGSEWMAMLIWRDGDTNVNTQKIGLLAGRPTDGKRLDCISSTVHSIIGSPKLHTITNNAWLKVEVTPGDYVDIHGLLVLSGSNLSYDAFGSVQFFWTDRPNGTAGAYRLLSNITTLPLAAEMGAERIGANVWITLKDTNRDTGRLTLIRSNSFTRSETPNWQFSTPSTAIVMCSAASKTHLMAEGLKSSDGGLTWQADGLPADAGAFVPEKRALSAAVWVASSSTGDIKLTKNFGVDWTLIESLTSNPYILRTTRG